MSNYLAAQGCWKGCNALKDVMRCHRRRDTADQRSIWLQMVIIASTVILVLLNKDSPLRIFGHQTSPDHLVIVFVWPGKLTDAQAEFCFKLNLSVSWSKLVLKSRHFYCLVGKSRPNAGFLRLETRRHALHLSAN